MPTTATILYQANCAFCNRCRAFVEKRDHAGMLRFIDIASPRAAELARQHGYVLHPPYKSIAFVHGTQWLEKYAACLAIARRMQRPWPIIGYVLSVIPHRIGDALYDLLSASRSIMR